MARPGKEQTFFFASAGLVALLATLLLVEEFRTPQIPAGKKFDPATIDTKPVAAAPRGVLGDRGWERGAREVFREPRDWLPMPPAELDRPPLREPSYVPPPPEPAVALGRYGLYRRKSGVTAHDFPADASGEAGGAEGDGDGDAMPTNAAPAPNGASASAPPRGLQAPTRDDEFQRKYDWLDLASDPRPWYVVLRNPDKFGLLERTNEELDFSRIDPVTGRVMIGGKLPRERIKPNGIHFAKTAANEAELLLRAVPQAQWGTATLPKLLDAAAAALALAAEDLACARSAVARLEKWVAIEPRQARTRELLADAKAMLLDFEGELVVLQAADREQVEGPGLMVRRARWLARAGAKSGALERLSAAVQRFPTDREARVAYGRALLDEGSPENIEKALQQFGQAEAASTSTEQRIEVIADAGGALLERGDAGRAVEEAKRILKIESQSFDGFRLEGAAQFALGRFADAESAFQRMAALARSDREAGVALYSLGVVRTRMGSFDLAKGDLARATQRDPLLAGRVAIAEAELLATTGHGDEAIARARASVARAPDAAFQRYHLGRLLRQAGDRAGARDELRRALDLGAGFPDLFDELGYLALEQGVAADARRYFEESLAREERDETRLLLAHAHLLAGDLGKARTLFEQLSSRQASSESLLGQAFCAYKSGDSLQAQQQWLQVKEELKNAHPDDVAYATRWLAAVLDLESKQVWEDALQWSEVGNGWLSDTRYGPDVKSSPPGNVRLFGVQKPPNDLTSWTYLHRDVELSLFHEYEVECSFTPDHQGRMGMGLVQWQAGASGQAPRLRAALTIALDVDGSVQLQRCEHVGEEAYQKIGTHAVKPGDTVRITLRRKAKGDENFQLFLDGAPLGEPVAMAPWKGRTRQQIAAVFLGSAPAGKKLDAKLERARRIEFLP